MRIAYSDVTDFPKGLEIQTSGKYNCATAGRRNTYSAKCQTLLSLLIFICASSIFFINAASPMTRAASLTSLQVSSRRVMTRTMSPRLHQSVPSADRRAEVGHQRSALESFKQGKTDTDHPFGPFIDCFHQPKFICPSMPHQLRLCA